MTLLEVYVLKYGNYELIIDDTQTKQSQFIQIIKVFLIALSSRFSRYFKMGTFVWSHFANLGYYILHILNDFIHMFSLVPNNDDNVGKKAIMTAMARMISGTNEHKVAV